MDPNPLRRHSTCCARGTLDGSARAQHRRAGLRYGSDLTDVEWAILQPFLPAEAGCGRKRAWPMRKVVNAICYGLRGGVPWRMVPDGFPPWGTVYRGVGAGIGSRLVCPIWGGVQATQTETGLAVRIIVFSTAAAMATSPS